MSKYDNEWKRRAWAMSRAMREALNCRNIEDIKRNLLESMLLIESKVVERIIES